MSDRLIPFLMFLFLAYLLFERAVLTPGRNEADGFSQRKIALSLSLVLLTTASATAQMTVSTSPTPQAQLAMAGAISKEDGSPKNKKENETLLEEMRQMRQVVERLEARVNQLEAEKSAALTRTAVPAEANPIAAATVQNIKPAVPQATTLSDDDRGVLKFFRGTTINATIDGHYGYNFNRPVGRINLLRAYDAQSNSFTLSQATVVIEREPDVEAGRRCRHSLGFRPIRFDLRRVAARIS